MADGCGQLKLASVQVATGLFAVGLVPACARNISQICAIPIHLLTCHDARFFRPASFMHQQLPHRTPTRNLTDALTRNIDLSLSDILSSQNRRRIQFLVAIRPSISIPIWFNYWVSRSTISIPRLDLESIYIASRQTQLESEITTIPQPCPTSRGQSRS